MNDLNFLTADPVDRYGIPIPFDETVVALLFDVETDAIVPVIGELWLDVDVEFSRLGCIDVAATYFMKWIKHD